MTRPNFLQSPQAWTRVQRTSIDSASYASAIEGHHKHKEPLGHRVVLWLGLFLLVCLVVALAKGY